MSLIRVIAGTMGVLVLQVAHAGGDSARGKTLFETCAFCHSIEDGRNGIGPSLWQVAGRRAAGVASYPYSAAFKALDQDWDDAHLDGFLAAPMQVVPGTKMTFAGVAEAQDRADLIAYLRSLQP